ncbi:MAG: beta-CASP ribonuclease aCPSF1 [Nanoarchaeota archaeon]|nr:beta-CASP ribonuclease aCPSF1 [Nanoarchaeota archaeon]MBU1321156.1 beta-CASP ribonuclease aCPSF1 [Nanoarchaeota archaeon]MBU1597485.1 beta-CASP ribonuclease aCPSF1 [Nanoarchaeota archaeon]MBU2441859.1 beta-CASP ribonuclease aCPSF1 [Nanoarchaeota archaeon]
MSEIIDEIFKHVPKNKISDAVFEGANIVLYTENKDFFLNDGGIVKEVVNMIKKRIELRPDPSTCMEQEKAEILIKKIITDEAGIDQIIFDPQRSIVIIEVQKPGLAIGKQGENLQEIKKQTLWVPQIKRTPAIRSKIIENIRAVLYQNNDYRRKFLHKTGQRIYNGWLRREKKEEWIRLSFLGGARQVGRSCYLLQTPESRVLLDCGIDVAANDDNAYPHLEAPEFDIKELDAVIISHAHLDHSGLIPYLFKFGYRGPIYCTLPTRDIMSLLQLDLVKIQRNEGKEPIYTSDDIKETVKHTICLDFEEVTDITPDVRITLYNAGHMLGSSLIHIHIGNGLHNFVYTGDLKYAKTNLLSMAATNFPRLETLMIESTYGAKDNILPPIKDADAQLSEHIISTIKKKGKVLLPVLGSGRAQEIIVLLDKLMREGQLSDKIPIYIDGMVWDITAIHTAYPEFLNSTVRQQIFHKDSNPFLRENITRIGSPKERKELLEEKGACIILATSGMLVGGPSVEYLKGLAEYPKNLLIFTCYQGEGSLGRRIQRGEREINSKKGNKIETIPIKMDIEKLEITGHSDRRELMSFIAHCNPKPKKIIVVHGESSKCLDLARSVHKSARIETIAPRNLDALRLR